MVFHDSFWEIFGTSVKRSAIRNFGIYGYFRKLFYPAHSIGNKGTEAMEHALFRPVADHRTTGRIDHLDQHGAGYPKAEANDVHLPSKGRHPPAGIKIFPCQEYEHYRQDPEIKPFTFIDVKTRAPEKPGEKAHQRIGAARCTYK
ncbi:MAG: hypothetical protein ABFR47_09000, partial [Verrucomicrobiota bacterium]